MVGRWMLSVISLIILFKFTPPQLTNTFQPCSIVAWVFSAKHIKRLVVEDFSK